jgi:hypothetical protein
VPTEPVPRVVVSTQSGVEGTSELVADCQAVGEMLLSLENFPDNPEVGEEINDEFKGAVQSLVADFEELDVQTDEVQSAVETTSATSTRSSPPTPGPRSSRPHRVIQRTDGAVLRRDLRHDGRTR